MSETRNEEIERFTSNEVPNMLSLTKDIVFEIEWGGDPAIGGSTWSVMSCGATRDEDVMTAYTHPHSDVILLQIKYPH